MWYTAADGTLLAQAGRRSDYSWIRTNTVATFEIKPPDMSWIPRELAECETRLYGDPVDSQRWTDSIVKGVLGNEKIVSPWYIWRKREKTLTSCEL
jgi:hypothetical protein